MQQRLRQIVTSCLKKSSEAGMTSIVLPAAGTGNLGYPRHVVATAMFDEVKIFSTNNPGTSLIDIRFSVFDQPTVQVRYFDYVNLFSTAILFRIFVFEGPP